MTLYDIDTQLEELCDPETGEISDFEKFDELNMERTEKIENVALWAKNLKSDIDALKKEEEAFYKRRKTAENKLKGLRSYLLYALNGDKFETTKCKVSFRTNKETVVDNAEGLIAWAKENGHNEYVRQAPPEVAKNAVIEAMKKGEEVPFVHTEENVSAIIK